MDSEKTIQERAEQVDKKTLDRWRLATYGDKLMDIASAIELSERTVRNAIRFGFATDTTKQKLNEYLSNKNAA